MKYEEYHTRRSRRYGTMKSTLHSDGEIQFRLEPSPGVHEQSYYWSAGARDLAVIIPAEAADDIMAVIGECLIEKARQDALEAVQTQTVPCSDIHREIAANMDAASILFDGEDVPAVEEPILSL